MNFYEAWQVMLAGKIVTRKGYKTKFVGHVIPHFGIEKYSKTRIWQDKQETITTYTFGEVSPSGLFHINAITPDKLYDLMSFDWEIVE